MSSVLLRVGPIGFGATDVGYTAIRRTVEAQWAAQPRLGRHPALQFTGWTDAISLPGVFHPFWRGGAAQVDQIRALVREGRPHLAADALGWVHGYWVLTSFETAEGHIAPNGVAAKIDFTLSMRYYGETTDGR